MKEKEKGETVDKVKMKKEYVDENGQNSRSNPILYFYSFPVNRLLMFVMIESPSGEDVHLKHQYWLGTNTYN